MEFITSTQAIYPGIPLQGLSMVYLYTEWCIPCHMMASVIDNLREYGDTVIIPINIEKDHEGAAFFQVYDIPTCMLFKNAKMVWQHSGIVSETVLRKMIELNQ
ncbi:MAG TPA: thioredoxin family protein [Ohtaekwangia sp.]|uniref:thioredoxin family protein n=1 Tax=Ohtaekwangia sp. TaxID=2066019 RepID=UPI002F9257F2